MLTNDENSNGPKICENDFSLTTGDLVEVEAIITCGVNKTSCCSTIEYMFSKSERASGNLYYKRKSHKEGD